MWKIPPRINKRIGKALHFYSMIEDGDRIIVAVSGGVDSMVLAAVLKLWKAKSPVEYNILAVNVDMQMEDKGKKSQPDIIKSKLEQIGIKCMLLRGDSLTKEEENCYMCSTKRRNMLFNLADKLNYNKIALGHHKDDLVETMLMNLFYSGNISTMRPRQDLFDGKISIIRPLSLLEKKEVIELAILADIQAVDNYCPIAGETKRDEIRGIVNHLEEKIPDVKRSVFAALSNVRDDYLL